MTGVLAAAAVLLGPLIGTGRSPLKDATVIAVGFGLAPVVTALLFGTSYAAAAFAGVGLAGFLFLLAGLGSVIQALIRSAAPAMIVTGVIGALMVASFHLGDPVLEWGGAGVPSHGALTVLHWVNPLCGAVGDGLGVDWLRLPIMYSGFPGSSGGGLSAAQYYDWAYPTFWAQAGLFAATGLSLMVVADRLAFRIPPGARGA